MKTVICRNIIKKNELFFQFTHSFYKNKKELIKETKYENISKCNRT